MLDIVKFELDLVEFLSDPDKEAIQIDFIPVRTLEESLKKMGYEDLEMNGEETNGWQIDFWYYFEHKTLPHICYSGSVHYGDFQLSKSKKGE